MTTQYNVDKRVVIYIKDGIVSVGLSVPRGVQVVIKNYDSEGFDACELQADEHGAFYSQVYTG